MSLVTVIRKKLSKRFSKNLAQKSLLVKLEKLDRQIAFLKKDFTIESLVPFFEATTAFIDSITSEERLVITEKLSKFIRISGRGAWNRTPAGEQTRQSHVWVCPVGHYDEEFRDLSLTTLLTRQTPKTNQGGHAMRPMDDKEFYFECFVKPYLKGKDVFLANTIVEFKQSMNNK